MPLCTFNLLQEFASPYIKGPSALGVPIYIVPTSIDSKGTERVTVEKVYTLIIADLEFAVGEQVIEEDAEAEARLPEKPY